METVKAGTILIDKKTNSVALVYRERLKDFSFPKGHLEDGETILECAIRETAEETKRIAEVVENIGPFIERYTTPRGEMCVVYFYLAFDGGKSDNTSTDTHDVFWIPFDEVARKLTHKGSKHLWESVYLAVKDCIE